MTRRDLFRDSGISSFPLFFFSFSSSFSSSFCSSFLLLLLIRILILLVLRRRPGVLAAPPFEERMRDFMTVIQIKADVKELAASVIAHTWRLLKVRDAINMAHHPVFGYLGFLFTHAAIVNCAFVDCFESKANDSMFVFSLTLFVHIKPYMCTQSIHVYFTRLNSRPSSCCALFAASARRTILTVARRLDHARSLFEHLQILRTAAGLQGLRGTLSATTGTIPSHQWDSQPMLFAWMYVYCACMCLGCLCPHSVSCLIPPPHHIYHLPSSSYS